MGNIQSYIVSKQPVSAGGSSPGPLAGRQLGSLESWELGKETVILACYSNYRWLFTAWRGGMEPHLLTGDTSPFTAPPPSLSWVQWGLRGGITCPSVGFAHMESWAGTQSLSSSISTARCSLRMTEQSSSVSAAPGLLSGEWREGQRVGDMELQLELTVCASGLMLW